MVEKSLFEILNETYWSECDNAYLRKDEYCQKCKNEFIACVCMQEDDE